LKKEVFFPSFTFLGWRQQALLQKTLMKFVTVWLKSTCTFCSNIRLWRVVMTIWQNKKKYFR